MLNFIKPWYLFRPKQIALRVLRAVSPPRNPVQVVELPWGVGMEIDITETIGRSIWTTGVYELAVAEVLYRLTKPGELAVDVGANVGAMTSVLAVRAGEVWSFEPQPVVFKRLSANVTRLTHRPGSAPCKLFDIALSSIDGTATIEFPEEFTNNHGTARLVTGREEGGGTRTTVRSARLDTVLCGRKVGVMKIDVEGHELAVLEGAAETLTAGRVRHVVFEDFGGADSKVHSALRGHGYTIFEIGWRIRGPAVGPPGANLLRPTEPPNYLATQEPQVVIAQCSQPGWHCLRKLKLSRRIA